MQFDNLYVFYRCWYVPHIFADIEKIDELITAAKYWSPKSQLNPPPFIF